MSGRATRIQRIPAPLLKWTSLFLILLTVTVTIFSGELPIARTSSKAFQVSTTGCIQFTPNTETCSQRGTGGTGGNGNCLQFNVSTGNCTAYDTDPGNKPAPGGCEAWDQGLGGGNGYCTAFFVNVTPTCLDGGTPPNCGDVDPQCTSSTYDPESGQCYVLLIGSTLIGSSNLPISLPLFPECPAPDSSSGVNSSSIQEITQTSQCYYPTSDASCAGAYSTQAGTQYCVAFFAGFTPQAGTQCAFPSGITGFRLPDFACFYILPDSNICAPGYTLVVVDCLKGGQDINTPLPNSVCPHNSVQQGSDPPISFTLSSQGVCVASNGITAFNISPTCRKGFIFIVGSGCLLNSGIFSLVDESSGPCSVSSIGYGDISGDTTTDVGDISGDTTTDVGDISGITYTCPYTNATLTCAINVPAVGSEHCTMSGSTPTYYSCTGLTPLANLNPTACRYEDTDSTYADLSNVAMTTKCTNSGQIDCMITSCYHTDTGKYHWPLATSPYCKVLTVANDIQLNLDQKCTNQADGLFLTCTYANTSNALQDKIEDFKLSNCKAGPVVCTATGPHQRQIRKECIATDQTNQGGPATCQIKDLHNSDKVLWVEICSPSNSGSFFPHCDIYQANSSGGSNTKLGSLDCSGSLASATCAIKDDSQNTTIIRCSLGSPNTTEVCNAQAPDCPYTGTAPGTGNNPTAAVTEATIVCDAALVVDELMGQGTPLLTDVQLTYPLSQAELEFVLAPPQLGIGSQSWTSESTQSHLPKVTTI